MRDPYAVYARRILMLAPLEPLDADAGGAERGQIIHAVLDEFVRTWPTELPPDPHLELHRIGCAISSAMPHRPQVWAVWWPRFERIAAWFCTVEERRRQEVARDPDRDPRRARAGRAGWHVPHPRPRRPDRGRHATADRIVDYKTGSPPRSSEVARGLSPQLTHRGADRRGAAGLRSSGGRDRALLFLQLRGGDPVAGEERDPVGRDGDLRQFLDDARRGLARLVAHFDHAATAYVPVPRPEIAPTYNDYAHLARIGEWWGTDRLERGAGTDAGRSGGPPTPAARSGSPPTPAPARPACWPIGFSGCCWRRRPGGHPRITFTKAAAAEMTGRIEERLAAGPRPRRRAAGGGAAETTGEPADAKRLERARRLFAQVLELPRGLGVMTIHALCGALLRRFPLEAGRGTAFRDHRRALGRRADAGGAQQVLRQAAGCGHGPGPGHAGPGRHAGRGTLGEMLAELLGQRLRLLRSRAASATSWRRCWPASPGHSAPSPGTSPPRWRRRPAPTASTMRRAAGRRRALAAGRTGTRARPRHRRAGSAPTRRSSAAAAPTIGAVPQGRRRRAADAGDQEGGLRAVCRRSGTSRPGWCAWATSCAACCWPRRTEALLRVAFADRAYEALKERSRRSRL